MYTQAVIQKHVSGCYLNTQLEQGHPVKKTKKTKNNTVHVNECLLWTDPFSWSVLYLQNRFEKTSPDL